ncbi:MAG TPA: penicillin-binding protein 2 [Bryobacteraceae bacterium]|nr:penicillin-binding protein 2 [Bryobacteraceae bacterium]
MSLIDTTQDRDNETRGRLLQDDTKFASAKIAVFQYVAVAILLFLLASFWDLQVRNPDYYNEAALRNSIRSIPALAPRGKILDRDGRVIVDNHSSFKAILNREILKREHLPAIAEGLHLDLDDLRSRVRRFDSRPKYVPIIIKQELTPGELAFVESHRDPETFPELELIHAQQRLYPKGGLASHVIGYVGEVSDAELNSPEFAKYSEGEVVGKDGIERQYNDSLMGIDGQRQVRVDSLGKEREVLKSKDAIPGHNLQLTIDLDLQAVAELSMENRKGAVVALDPRSGEVLAMVSRPSFDPNIFGGHIRAEDWKAIANNPDHPLLNRAIQAQLAPGSTFKPIMALAGLESGIIDDGFKVHCSGGAMFYGRYFKCFEKEGHGTVDLHKGIVRSCDVFFYNVGNKLGIDRIAKYAEMAGLGHKTGIDLPHEADGIVPSPKWKIRNFRQKWYLGETISVSIGQGATTVTPLQLASAIGGIAIGGEWHRPHLVKEATQNTPVRKADLNPDNIAQVISGMYGVVNEYGTATRARIPGIDVCGKTGTAQLASNEYLKANKLGQTKSGVSMEDNAWFVGFAPRQAPEIVVVALVENGGQGGIVAAPVVRDIIKAYFDKKARVAVQTQLAKWQAEQPGIGFARPTALVNIAHDAAARERFLPPASAVRAVRSAAEGLPR